MKRASEYSEVAIPRKCIKQNREELQSADTATLIEKILSLTDQLNEANEMVRSLKTRVALSRLQVIQKDKEVKDLLKERNDAYYSGIGMGSVDRDQLLDPFFYESFISMKEKIAKREKEIADLKETVKALGGGKDCKILYQFLESKNSVMRKMRENEKNVRKISTLENKLALAHTALRLVRREKKERDSKIAELEKDLYQFRHSVLEEVASEHTELDLEEEVKQDVSTKEQGSKLEEKQTLTADTVEHDCDVVVLDDKNAGIVVHDGSDAGGLQVVGIGSGCENRTVSMDENDVLKITV